MRHFRRNSELVCCTWSTELCWAFEFLITFSRGASRSFTSSWSLKILLSYLFDKAAININAKMAWSFASFNYFSKPLFQVLYSKYRSSSTLWKIIRCFWSAIIRCLRSVIIRCLRCVFNFLQNKSFDAANRSFLF